MWEPGGGVLRNKLNLHDLWDLRTAEYRLSADRQLEIERGEVRIPRTFGPDHLRAVHGHLFKDVYEWAGQFRDVNLSKDGQAFAHHEDVGLWLDKVRRLVTGRDWSTMDREEFVRDAAEVYAYLNVAHPFREGNGRTGKLFMSHVAELSPYRLDYDKVEKHAWNEASAAACPEKPWEKLPEPEHLEAVFDATTVDRQPAAAAADPETARAVGLLNSTYQTGAGQAARTGADAGERPLVTSIAARHDREAGRGD